jgi:uncharacterized metal-binding protein
MSDANSHQCVGGERLIFACSGAADVGAISDQAARRLTKDGKGKMFCLTGIGGRVPGILDKTRTALHLLAIDGCPLDCAKKTLEQAGFARFEHVRVTDLGLEKGKSPVTEESISRVTARAAEMIGS